MAYKKKQKSTFEKVTWVFVWIMIILTLLSVVAALAPAF